MIGQSMGVTKQAAQKRFVAGKSSLDRFTDRAKVVVLKAQLEARSRGHQEVTSLHLLLGLLAEWNGYTGLAIESAGATKAAVAAAVGGTAARGRTDQSPCTVLDRSEEGARADRARVVALGSQLRRHRTHPARSARSTGGSRSPGADRAWRLQDRGGCVDTPGFGRPRAPAGCGIELISPAQHGSQVPALAVISYGSGRERSVDLHVQGVPAEARPGRPGGRGRAIRRPAPAVSRPARAGTSPAARRAQPDPGRVPDDPDSGRSSGGSGSRSARCLRRSGYQGGAGGDRRR